MFVKPDAVERWQERYGQPREMSAAFEISADDLAMVRASMRNGRAHDVTLFIFCGENWADLALIRKASFPIGAFRAPSGGLAPGEELEVGAIREALEETGLDIALERYLLRVHARFLAGEDGLDWVSHVFSARAIGGRLEALDRDEIAEVAYGSIAELQGPIRALLLAADRGLFRYRVALTDAVIEVLREAGWRL